VSSSSLIRPCVGQLADLALWEAGQAADPLAAESALVSRLSAVPDRRARCGLRHPLLVILALTACATLTAGSYSVAAIWQWAARTSQEKLERLGARRDAFTGRFIVPSERTFRRVLADLDGDTLDAATCGYVTDVTRGAALEPQIPATPGRVAGMTDHMDVLRYAAGVCAAGYEPGTVARGLLEQLAVGDRG
jgi:hypothetical protein